MPFFGHKSRREREFDEVKESAQDDLVSLGDDIRSLDVDIQMPSVPGEAKQRYEQALQAYQRASEIFDRAKRPEDLAPVSETLEEGRYAMAYAKALLEGKPPRSGRRRASSIPATGHPPNRWSGLLPVARPGRFRLARRTRSGSRTASSPTGAR